MKTNLLLLLPTLLALPAFAQEPPLRLPVTIQNCIVDPTLQARIDDLTRNKDSIIKDCDVFYNYDYHDGCVRHYTEDLRYAQDNLQRTSDFFTRQEWGKTTVTIDEGTPSLDGYTMHIKAPHPWSKFTESEFTVGDFYKMGNYKGYSLESLSGITVNLAWNPNSHQYTYTLVTGEIHGNPGSVFFKCAPDDPSPILEPVVRNGEIYDDRGQIKFPRRASDHKEIGHWYSLYDSRYPAHTHYKFVNSSNTPFNLGQAQVHSSQDLLKVVNHCPAVMSAGQSCDVDFFFDARGYVDANGIWVDFNGTDFTKFPVSFSFSSRM